MQIKIRKGVKTIVLTRQEANELLRAADSLEFMLANGVDIAGEGHLSIEPKSVPGAIRYLAKQFGSNHKGVGCKAETAPAV